MRDGVKLNTEIYTPSNMTESLPFIITRTPYGQRYDSLGIQIALSGKYEYLAQEQYIFVFQDIRGRYESEGNFKMLRQVRTHNDSIDEGTDTFDTIDWLLKNIENNNGKAGMLGISYDGWLTVMSLLEPHPALVAASPQASPSDMFIGDDFVHNGAFRLSPSFGYAALMESGKTNMPFQFDPPDVYDFYLNLGALSNADKKYFKGNIPSWNDFMEHPDYDEYWQSINVDQHLKKVAMPTLNVAGWWDAEDFYGPLKIYETLEQFDEQGNNFIVIGPWQHGGWAGQFGGKLGDIGFESNTSAFYRKEIEAPFFSHYLKGEGEWNLKESRIFQTGSNQWKDYDSWSPEDKETTNLYLVTDGNLSLGIQKTSENEFRSYISDPANPVPYTKRPISGFWQEPQAKALWRVEDQRFVYEREDVISWQSELLEKDLCIAGNIIASLNASTSGTDSDWIVKLIDVYPENDPDMAGYQLMIADEVLRAKYRNSYESPEPLISNKITHYEIDLNSRNHCFKKGHRIMVQIQSTWFPLIGRNPQKFIEIPKAKNEDYQLTEQRIYNTTDYPSFIRVSLD